MIRNSVFSSNLKSVGYDDGTLEIEFHNGGIYQYFNVPDSTYSNLISAISKGRYFDTYIRPKYRYRKVH